jgi:RNA polymerase sigma factor (sigma-70 family)
MLNRHSESVAGAVQTLFQFGAMGAWTDGQLLAQFLAGREGREAAFRVLLKRHGPMVLGVCRRVLGDAHSADDAFQATFLVLARKAGSLRHHDLLAGWLYGVAHRVSRKAKAQAARRRDVERRAAGPEAGPAGDPDAAELRTVIDEEIRGLPERYRLPLILCYLEGLHHHEVAQRLGCPVGTVESRLSRARERLRTRLARRGLAPTSASLAVLLAATEADSAPVALVESALRAAAGLANGRAGTGAAVALASLARSLGGVTTHLGGLKLASLVACAGVAAVSVGVYRAGGAPARERTVVESPRDVFADPAPPPQPGDLPTLVQAQDEPKGKNHDEDELPRPDRSPYAVARPLRGITIDGRLDDWPKDLPEYPILNGLTGRSNYDPVPRKGLSDPDSSFMVGYSREDGVIYLAVVVRDGQLVADGKDPFHTDSVEVYVDGTFSERKFDGSHISAQTMPVLQYAAVPGRVRAYGDPKGANPSLVYGDVGRTTTTMSYHREGDITTYEWAIQPFDRYPDRPTRLVPGKKLGFDVAVADMDPDRSRQYWFCWGSTPTPFKGFDSGQLGELVLTDGP